MRRLANIAPTLAITALVIVAFTSSLSAIAGEHGKKGKAGDIVDVAVAADTVNGSAVSISVEDGNVLINDATVVAADIEASNGVIHIVDTVILPQI